MPNLLDKNLRGGDRSEYLAQYVLSALGVSVQVMRPEDYGVDYFCSLQKEEGRRLTFDSPFIVQLGSTTADGCNKRFSYGGLTENKDSQKRVHRAWEIEFLRKQHLPLFVGTADKKEHRLRLYSTSPMWHGLHRWVSIGEIELLPEDTRNIDTETKVADLEMPDGSRLPRYVVPLGPPVVDITIMDLSTDKLDKAREALRSAVALEQRNLLYRELDVLYFLRLREWIPNEPTGAQSYSFTLNQAVLKSTPEFLRPVIIMMAMAYKQQGNHAALEKIRGMLTLLPLGDEDKKILAAWADLTGF